MLRKQFHILPPHDAGSSRATPALCKRKFAQYLEKGVTVIDGRNALDFGKGFAKGAINIGIDGDFDTWIKVLIPSNTPIVFIAPDGRELEMEERLHALGYEQLLGFLPVKKLFQTSCTNAACEQITIAMDFVDSCSPNDFENYATIPGIVILDIRESRELPYGKIPKSLWIPLREIPGRIHMFDEEKTYLIYCQSGYRSMIAASLLINEGIVNVINVVGGVELIKQVKPELLAEVY
jgi:rhodanese-related sulfurtransferase